MSSIQEKTQLRTRYSQSRDALDPLARKRASSLIRQRIFKHPTWREAERILCYVSFRSEVDTHTLLQEGIRFKKKMHVPLFQPADTSLTLISELKRWGDLIENKLVVMLEPREDARLLIDPTCIQVVLVPGLAFDRQGGRLGFGGGYFDRLLAKMPQAKRIGVAFADQVMDTALPQDVHDVRMHAIITEKEEIIPQ